jgi:predicted transcriptional regulator
MNSAIERLVSLKVGDIMNTSVLTVAESDDMQTAARRICDAEVSGAPVVNTTGRCVGMLSANDFVSRDAGRHEMQILTRTGPNEAYQVECLNDSLVCSHMSPLVQTVAETEGIVGAARLMCLEGIHRLVVIDQKERPVGIISTLDVAAALVNAVEE